MERDTQHCTSWGLAAKEGNSARHGGVEQSQRPNTWRLIPKSKHDVGLLKRSVLPR